MPFNRSVLFHGYTLAWRLFKRHHTQLNSMFWAHTAAKEHSCDAAEAFSTSDPTGRVFTYATSHLRVPATVKDWTQGYADFDEWTRLASVLAVSGYLETFIAQIANAALESNPSLVFGGGMRVEGAVFLKRNAKYDLYEYVEKMVRGEWPKRIRAYRKHFANCPFERYKNDLEELRKLRNDAGHTFGRAIKSMRFAAGSLPSKFPKVSDRKLQLFLAVAESVAMLVENHLGPSEVGQYEIIRLLHHWLPTNRSSGIARRSLARAFTKYITSVTGNGYGIDRAVELIDYYDAL